MAALALLTVLIVIGALAASNFVGSDGDQNAGSSDAGQNNTQGGNNGQSDGQAGGGSGENQGQGGDQQGAPSSASAGASATPEQAAEETLQRVYTAAASEEYGTSYGLLSQNFKASEGVTEAEWANTFADLQRIRFVEGPDARVSGNTATVEGVTIAENAGRTERNTVTWRMVKEGGGWKLDGIPTFRQEPVSG